MAKTKDAQFKLKKYAEICTKAEPNMEKNQSFWYSAANILGILLGGVLLGIAGGAVVFAVAELLPVSASLITIKFLASLTSFALMAISWAVLYYKPIVKIFTSLLHTTEQKDHAYALKALKKNATNIRWYANGASPEMQRNLLIQSYKKSIAYRTFAKICAFEKQKIALNDIDRHNKGELPLSLTDNWRARAASNGKTDPLTIISSEYYLNQTEAVQFYQTEPKFKAMFHVLNTLLANDANSDSTLEKQLNAPYKSPKIELDEEITDDINILLQSWRKTMSDGGYDSLAKFNEHHHLWLKDPLSCLTTDTDDEFITYNTYREHRKLVTAHQGRYLSKFGSIVGTANALLVNPVGMMMAVVAAINLFSWPSNILGAFVLSAPFALSGGVAAYGLTKKNIEAFSRNIEKAYRDPTYYSKKVLAVVTKRQDKIKENIRNIQGFNLPYFLQITLSLLTAISFGIYNYLCNVQILLIFNNPATILSFSAIAAQSAQFGALPYYIQLFGIFGMTTTVLAVFPFMMQFSNNPDKTAFPGKGPIILAVIFTLINTSIAAIGYFMGSKDTLWATLFSHAHISSALLNPLGIALCLASLGMCFPIFCEAGQGTYDMFGSLWSKTKASCSSVYDYVFSKSSPQKAKKYFTASPVSAAEINKQALRAVATDHDSTSDYENRPTVASPVANL